MSFLKDGLGPHAVILVATSEKPFQQAAEYVRPRGTVVFIGLPAGAKVIAPVFESVVKMITIRASYVGNRKDSAEAIELFRRGGIKAPFKVIGLSELQKVYDLMVSVGFLALYVGLVLMFPSHSTKRRLLAVTSLIPPSKRWMSSSSHRSARSQ